MGEVPQEKLCVREYVCHELPCWDPFLLPKGEANPAVVTTTKSSLP